MRISILQVLLDIDSGIWISRHLFPPLLGVALYGTYGRKISSNFTLANFARYLDFQTSISTATWS